MSDAMTPLYRRIAKGRFKGYAECRCCGRKFFRHGGRVSHGFMHDRSGEARARLGYPSMAAMWVFDFVKKGKPFKEHRYA